MVRVSAGHDYVGGTCIVSSAADMLEMSWWSV